MVAPGARHHGAWPAVADAIDVGDAAAMWVRWSDTDPAPVPQHLMPTACARLALFVVLCAAGVAWPAAAAGFARATKENTGPRPCDVAAGEFADLRLDDLSAGSQCWKCPDGYTRTGEPVTSSEACAKGIQHVVQGGLLRAQVVVQRRRLL